MDSLRPGVALLGGRSAAFTRRVLAVQTDTKRGRQDIALKTLEGTTSRGKGAPTKTAARPARQEKKRRPGTKTEKPLSHQVTRPKTGWAKVDSAGTKHKQTAHKNIATHLVKNVRPNSMLPQRGTVQNERPKHRNRRWPAKFSALNRKINPKSCSLTHRK